MDVAKSTSSPKKSAGGDSAGVVRPLASAGGVTSRGAASSSGDPISSSTSSLPYHPRTRRTGRGGNPGKREGGDPSGREPIAHRRFFNAFVDDFDFSDLS